VPDGTDFLRGADRRLTAARADLAAAHLKGSVDSARFAEATPMQVKAAIIPLRPAPDSNVGIDTVLLFGESFDAYDVAEGWVWGQSKRDGYVGYVPQAALSPEVSETTHTVAVPATVWGGKTVAGIDCSGLMQVALARAGIPAPRDSDMLREVGKEVAPDSLQRGDMLFWKGHVGVMSDADTLRLPLLNVRRL